MVISTVITAVGTEVAALALSESHAEVIGCRVYRRTHVRYTPSTRAGLLCPENVKATISGMAIGGEIEHRIAPECREHLIAGSIDPLAQILKRAGPFFQVYAPYIEST